MAMHINYEKRFHSQLAINGIPLKLALFFVVIVQARNDGSIGVFSARSSTQRMTKSAPRLPSAVEKIILLSPVSFH